MVVLKHSIFDVWHRSVMAYSTSVEGLCDILFAATSATKAATPYLVSGKFLSRLRRRHEDLHLPDSFRQRIGKCFV